MQVALIVLLGLLVVAGLVAAFIWQRRRQAAAILGESQTTRARFDELAAQADALTTSGSELLSRVTGPVGAGISAMIAELGETRAEASTAVALLPTPSTAKFSTSDAQRDHRSAERSLNVLKGKVAKGEKLVASSATRLDLALEGIDELKRLLATARQAATDQAEAGWNMEPVVAELSTLDTEAARLNIEPPIDPAEIEPELKALSEQAKALIAEAEGVAVEHRRLVELSVEQWKRSTELRGEGEWLVNQLEAWELLHHPKSLETVSEHPPAITGRLDEADVLLDEAGGDSGMLVMGRQDIRGAAHNLARSGELISQVHQLISEARHLNVELATAAVEAKNLVPRAESASNGLAAYVDEHSHDLQADFAETVASFKQMTVEATAKLNLRPPDALNAMRLANEIIDRSAERSVAAKAEVKRMDQLRTTARNALHHAAVAVNSLDRYTDGILASMFSGSRRSNVARLQRQLASAQGLNKLSVNDPVKARQTANVIKKEASDLLEKYKRDDAASYDD